MIVSKQNSKVQRVRALLSRRRERENQNAFVLEGVRLIEEALQAGAVPQLLLYSENAARAEAIIEQARNSDTEIEEVEPGLLDSISDTKTSQGILAVFGIEPRPIPHELDYALILDSISDPGNLGTILRTAASAGVQLVILAPDTTDPYAPKVVRAGMGAHFYLPIHAMGWSEIEQLAKKDTKRLHMFASDVNGGASCWESDLRQPLALVIGSEATGISKDAQLLADSHIHIPMQGKIESLNASTAASILIFEVIRQRRS